MRNRISATWGREMAKSNRHGFTLVEMAVVLVILGLLLSALIIPISTQIDQRNYAETRKSLDEIREALIGYGLTRGYLPCPAISALNGLEDRNIATGLCNNRVGFLPWVELGVGHTDGWGHLYRYSVTPAYANSLTSVTLSTLGDITIATSDGAGGYINLTTAAAPMPAAVFSQGKNGNSAVDINGNILPDASTTNLGEDANSNSAGTALISRDISDNTATAGGEFDDLVVWISPRVYLSRLINAGRLP